MELKEGLKIFSDYCAKYKIKNPKKYLICDGGIVFYVPSDFGMIGCNYYLLNDDGLLIPTNPILIGDEIKNMKDL